MDPHPGMQEPQKMEKLKENPISSFKEFKFFDRNP
jgi:hypothetical protein